MFVSSQNISNYINNGSFELQHNCLVPYISTAKYWRPVDSLTGNVDFNSTCFPNVPYGTYGFQWARSGQNYGLTGFLCQPPACSNSYNRGYFRNRLKTTLQAGKTYCVKFYINISDNSSYAIDGFGAYFGDNTLDTITKGNIPLTYLTAQIQNPINNIITDTLNWTLITGTFVANGTEKHCVIGNFKSDAATNKTLINTINTPNVYCNVLLDDVSCIPLDLPAYAAPGPNIWAIPGNTIYLGRPQDVGIDEACQWFKLPNTTSVIATAAGITLTVSTITSTYMVKQDICGVIKYDTVVVYASGVGLNEAEYIKNSINVYPNPANDVLNVSFNSDLAKQFTTIIIYNNLGQVIREEEINSKEISIDTKDFMAGVYFFNLISHTLGTVSKRLVIAR